MYARKHYELVWKHTQHALKTGLACTLAYVISTYALSSSTAIWAVVSTIIAMQGASVAESFQAGLMRLSGMAIGAVAGVLLLLITPNNFFWLTLMTFILGVAGAYLTRYGGRYMLAAISACTVLLAGSTHLGTDAWQPILFGLTLVMEIVIGVGAALVVSLTIWPVRMGDLLQESIAAQFTECAALLNSIVDSFINGQQQLPPRLLRTTSAKARGNHENFSKMMRHEAYIYRYRASVLDIQMLVIDRAVAGMRTLLDALNEYDEASRDLPLSKELRELCTTIMEALAHIGGKTPLQPRPDLVRSLTSQVDAAESRLAVLHLEQSTPLPLHRLMQIFVFYQIMRQLSEEILLALHELHSMSEKHHRPKTEVI